MPANPHKGEVEFEARGETWTLRYSTNAICALEDDLDMGVEDIIERLQGSPRMSLVRAVFRAGLGDVSAETAGDLVDAVGFARAAGLIGEAFERAFPNDAPAQPEANDSARPRKGGGTGRNS